MSIEEWPPVPGRSANEPAGMAQTSRDAVIGVDGSFRIVMLNPAAQHMFGLAPGQAWARPLADLMSPGVRELFDRGRNAFIQSGATEAAWGTFGPLRGLRADGEEFLIDLMLSRAQSLPGGAGEMVYLLLLRDSGPWQPLPGAMDSLNHRLRSLFEQAPVAIWITENDQVVYANRACLRLFGISDLGSLVGRSVYQLLSPSSHEAFQAQLKRAAHDSEEATKLIGRITRVDGAPRDVELVVASLPDHGRTFVQMALTDITQRSAEHRLLLRSRRTLRELSASLVDAREKERQRIARELHDELGQRLTALKLSLASQLGTAGTPAQRAEVDAMIRMVDETVNEVRRIAMDLRPPMLDDLGLVAAIEWLSRQFESRSGLHVSVRIEVASEFLHPELSTPVYRIVQEALTNISRHARATRVDIRLHVRGGQLQLTVQDNGVGFGAAASQKPAGSFGLIGIRERALMLGGSLWMGRSEMGGARLEVRLPLHPSVRGVGTVSDDFDATSPLEQLVPDITPGDA